MQNFLTNLSYLQLNKKQSIYSLINKMKQAKQKNNVQQKVLNYKDLSENKKAEFLSFLMNNNIKFQEGQENYYAKVVIKDNKNTTNTQKKQAKKGTSPLKPIFKQNITVVNKSKSHRLNLAVSDRSIEKQQKHQKIQIKTPLKKERNVSKTLNSSSSEKNKEDNQKIQKIKKSKSNNQQAIRGRNPQLSTRELKRKSKQKDTKTTPIKVDKSRQKVHQKVSTPTLQKKQSDIARIQEKLQPYLKIFKINFIESRPIRWPKHQLNRALQQIYTANFIKNTILLKSKKIKLNFDKNFAFAQFILEFYNSKFKTKKHSHCNIVNLINSLLYHLEIEFSTNLIIFSKFLQEEYEYQDLVFFLFIRSILEKQFGVNMQKLSEKKQKKPKDQEDYELDFNYFLNKKQINKFIKAFVGKQTQLIPDLQKNVYSQMKLDKIPVYELFLILIEDYHHKSKTNRNYQQSYDSEQTFNTPKQRNTVGNINLNISREKNYSKTGQKLPFSTNQKTSDIQQYQQYNQLNYSHQEELQELTFGQQNKPNQYNHTINSNNNSQLRQQAFKQQSIENIQNFWDCKQINELKITDELEKMIMQKMRKKVEDLLEIMIGDEEDLKFRFQNLHKLILRKSYNLIDSIFGMDKLKWFSQLNIMIPTTQQLQYVENLQLLLRKLRKNPDNKMLSDFCKHILTTEQLKRAIQKQMVG